MITSAEKSQIRQLLQSPQWRTIEHIKEMYIQRVRDISNLHETEWETAKSVALEEGRVNGINEFFQELMTQAQNDQT